MSGEELKDIRLKLKLTQAELAAKVGVNLRSLQYWEKNERKVPETTAYFINDLLKNEQSSHENNEVNYNNESQIIELQHLLNTVTERIAKLQDQKDLNSLLEIREVVKYKYKIQEDLDSLRSR